jgi:nicotinamide-nucleotide amidase
MLPPDILELAEAVLAKARARGLKITTAESCTGGLVAGALTAIAGSSDVFERGFVTYSNQAKAEMLGVDPRLIETHGAVSPQTAEAMAKGALAHAQADLAVAVTGIAGPGGGSVQKPVGLVYFGAASAADVSVVAARFGDIGRDAIRAESVRQALRLLLTLAEAPAPPP